MAAALTNHFRIEFDGPRRGGFAELTYRAPGQSEDNGWWEAIGLTQRDDRLMIIINRLNCRVDVRVSVKRYEPTPVPQMG